MKNSELKAMLINNIFATPKDAKAMQAAIKLYSGAMCANDIVAFHTALGMFGNYIASQLEIEPEIDLVNMPILQQLLDEFKPLINKD